MSFDNAVVEENKDPLIVIDEQKKGLSKDFSLDRLTSNLVLTTERAKFLNNLYEKNSTLKEQSSELSKQLDDEKQLNNLQAEFVSLVSHEFKTPLAIIKASSDVAKRLLESPESKENVVKQLEKINKAIIRMTNLIESTLNLSKLETGNLQFIPTHFCIKDLILDIIERFAELNDRVIFKVNISNDVDSIYADKSLIDQVFMNLIGNAIKYSKENPTVTVIGKIDGNKIKISVRDNGIGMDQEDLNRLFGKFFRAKNSVGIAGTGIGLYLCRKFMEIHQGDITAKSELNIGTEFTITLPIKQRPS